jgi:uncharacterized membrane protein
MSAAVVTSLVERSGTGISMGRTLLTLGATAAVLDAFTTWVALRHAGLHERTAATAALIGMFGLAGGLLMSVAVRIAVFALVAVLAERMPRLSRPLLTIGFAAVAIAWLVVAWNITALASTR